MSRSACAVTLGAYRDDLEDRATVIDCGNAQIIVIAVDDNPHT